MSAYVITRKGQTLETPSFISFLFNDKRAAFVWLAARLWLGWEWIQAGLHKIESPDWMVTGKALKGFWMGAIQIPEQGRPPIAYDWYRNFLQAMLNAEAYVWFAKLIAVGEVVIGIALIAGMFMGVTAFLAGFMNWNFIMAGSASVNGVFFGLAVILVLAWKIAGYYGLDYFILPRIADLWLKPRTIQN